MLDVAGAVVIVMETKNVDGISTQYPCRRETARMTCVEDVELLRLWVGMG